MKGRSYNRSYQVQGVVRELIGDLDFQFIPLWCVKVEKKEKRLLMNPTFCARITGPGNVPEASVVLKYALGQRRFRTAAAGDSQASVPIGSQLPVDYIERRTNDRSGDTQR